MATMTGVEIAVEGLAPLLRRLAELPPRRLGQPDLDHQGSS